MRNRLLTCLLCAFVAALIPAAAPNGNANGTVTIVAECPTGTNWDTILHKCV